MTFPIYRRTTVAILSISICFAGCGLIKKSPVNYRQAPISNITVGEKALKEAFINSGIPVMNSADEYSLEISRDKKGMTASTALEYFIGRGWKLNTKKTGIPNVSISLDTVFVRISCITSGKGKTVLRHSEAKIKVVVNKPDSTKAVYSGAGIYEDNPPFEWVKSHPGNDDFVSLSSDFRQMYTFIKPLLYSVTGTAFIWLFYSYRN
jgi:hypothetical protein